MLNIINGRKKKRRKRKESNMEYQLAKGIIKEGANLNLLVIRDEETQIEKTIAYNLSYEIEKILRTHLNKKVELSLLVEELK